MSGYHAYTILSVVISSISLLCSILLFATLRKMKFNGFIMLICSLAVSTFFYNLIYYFKLEKKDWGEAIYIDFEIFFDTSMSAWVNTMMLILMRMVKYLNTVDIYHEYPYYLGINIFISLFLFIFHFAQAGIEIDRESPSYRLYSAVRFIQFCGNILLYVITYYFLSYLPKHVQSQRITSSQAEALKALVYRMILYGLVQALMRIGAIWYTYDISTLNSLPAAYCSSILSPLCGICYFLIFLYMQPGAYEIFMNDVYTFIPWLKPLRTPEEDESRDTVAFRISEASFMDSGQLSFQIEGKPNQITRETSV